MKINNQNVKVNIFINPVNELNLDYLQKYFINETIETSDDEDEFDKYSVLITNSEISNDKIKELLKYLTTMTSFELIIDSDKKNIYEKYIYTFNDDFITKCTVSDDYCQGNGVQYLIGILFHINEQKILLENL